ncbi:MAG: hypothetical protein R3E12_10485 [Candidatus Eisenbacteria bacterium]
MPSHAVRGFVASMSGPAPAVWVIASKGLEEGTCLRMTEVVAQSSREPLPAVVLAGPSLAREVSAGKPTALLAASDDDAEARRIQKRFASERFRSTVLPIPSASSSRTSLKNVVALAAGTPPGSTSGRTRALGALVTRGLAEITRSDWPLGARMETFLDSPAWGIWSRPVPARSAGITRWERRWDAVSVSRTRSDR